MTPEIPYDDQTGRRVYKRKPKDPRKLVYDREITLYGGEVTMYYNDDLHVYWTEVLDAPGRYLVSTTSVTKVIDKPALIPWAVRETLSYVRRHWTAGKPFYKSSIEGILKSAQNARFVLSEEATDIGTIAHDWCEQYALAAIAGEDHMPDLPHGSDNDDRARLACEAFLNWVRAHDVTFLAAERKVFSGMHGYSGTFDLLAIVDGHTYIVDFKTSKRIYDEYELQIAGYAGAIHEEQAYIRKYDLFEAQGKLLGVEDFGPDHWYMNPIERGLILHIPKNGDDFGIRVVEDLPGRYDVFRSCLNIIDWQKGNGKFAPEPTEARTDLYRTGQIDILPMAA